jgi:hypothetical protein
MNKSFFVQGPHNILLMAGILGCLMCIPALLNQWYFDSEVRILAIENVCQQPLNNRCQREYLVEHKDKTLSKISSSFFSFKSDDLAVGDSLTKHRFSFGYQVNGKAPTFGYTRRDSAILFLSLLALGLWRYFSLRKRRSRGVSGA